MPSLREASRLDYVLIAFPFAGEVAGLTPGPPRVSHVEVRVQEVLREWRQEAVGDEFLFHPSAVGDSQDTCPFSACQVLANPESGLEAT